MILDRLKALGKKKKTTLIYPDSEKDYIVSDSFSGYYYNRHFSTDEIIEQNKRLFIDNGFDGVYINGELFSPYVPNAS